MKGEAGKCGKQEESEKVVNGGLKGMFNLLNWLVIEKNGQCDVRENVGGKESWKVENHISFL